MRYFPMIAENIPKISSKCWEYGRIGKYRIHHGRIGVHRIIRKIFNVRFVYNVNY